MQHYIVVHKASLVRCITSFVVHKESLADAVLRNCRIVSA
jgi:hypothetical protein